MSDSIFDAAFAGNLEAVRVALQRGASPDEPGPDGSNALHLASMAGHHHIVEFLLDAGADVNASDADGFSVLQATIMAAGQKPKARLELIQTLIRRGADLTHRAPMAGSLVETARNYRRPKKIIDLLIESGAPTD